jgi:prolyl oligopeptidase
MPKTKALLVGALALACTPSPRPATPPPSSSATPASSPATPPVDAPPTARKAPVVDEYHGVRVSDDYRWLEDASAPAVQKWSDDENAFARRHLDALAGRDTIRARVSELLAAKSADYFSLTPKAERIFALEERPPKQQAFLVEMKTLDDAKTERVVLDPNALDASGKTSIDFYVPSPDGKKVAVSLSVGGSEDGTVHVYDVATGKETGDVIPRVNGGTAGGSVAWTGDGKHLYYTRYPHAGERAAADLSFFQQIWVHELGKPVTSDVYSLGKDFPRIAEIELETSPNGKYVLARVANGDGGEFMHFLLGPNGKWQSVAKLEDKVIDAHFGLDDALYLLSRSDAPKGKLLRLSPAQPALSKARLAVPESDAVIQGFVATRSHLYVVDMVGGPSQIRIFDLEGRATGTVPILPVSSVTDFEALGADDLVFRNQSYTDPPAFHRFDAKSGKTAKTSLASTSPADFSDAEVTLDHCTSKDGTQVPMTLVAKKGSPRDGKNPTLLTGYGGYGVSRTPRFRPISRLWLDAGGIVAVANIRGGGEFGEAWHRAGNLENKQNVFDDFAACMQRLSETRVTSPAKLAVIGGSNGGLLMGAEIVQHPQAFHAVVSYVGIYDMLRVETTPNGAFNVTEFGSVKDPAQFRALYAYSPYHNVKDGTAYPATLMLTGANDPRVDPYNSRKMIARLQAATSSSAPILLRVSKTTGHGISNPLDEEIAESVDVYSFLFTQLGMQLSR